MHIVTCFDRSRFWRVPHWRIRPALCRFHSRTMSVMTLCLGLIQVPVSAEQTDDHQVLTETVIPYLQKYCVDCHGPEEQMAGIGVHELKSTTQLLPEYSRWIRVYRMIDAGAMPPLSHQPFPAEAEQIPVAAFFRNALLNFDCSGISHPGRPTIRRLNRAEYNNTVRDLFGITVTPADEFPFDDVGEGFDNIGDVLSVPPLLMEKYLNAAEIVAGEVIDQRDFSKPETQRFTGAALVSSLKTTPDGLGFVKLHSKGTVTAKVSIPYTGDYLIRVEVAADQAGDEPARIGFQLDGQQIAESTTEPHNRPKWYEHKYQLPTGEHEIAAAFLNDFYDKEAPGGPADRNIAVRAIEVIGPAKGRPPAWHDIHQRIVISRPDSKTSVRAAATAVFQPLLYRAFRRPVTRNEVDRFADLVDRQVRLNDETFERGLSIAIQAMLVSKNFLFRQESDPRGKESTWALNNFEVATRLSYFLWSSMPDDELMSLAARGRLLKPEVLKKQIARMLSDPRSAALADNFLAQWLNLRNLADARPDIKLYPGFDGDLRSAMEQETKVFFNSLVRENGSVDDLLLADYTFVNKRMAEHYGIEGVTGDDFVRVSLQGKNRSGVVTHASILTLTSNPGRTSPVKRGKWILDNLLGQAPPPAPPAVPTLEETAKAAPDLSLRQQMELHRKDPGCASCHRVMDPLGMGLENFDAVGRWRDKDGEKSIDAGGTLPSGENFSGPLQMVEILGARRNEFRRTLTERMLVYAVGRGLGYYDKCAVDQILTRLDQQGATVVSLIEGIVLSDPFLKRSRQREPAASAE
jgi:hypothetical protein